jgi:adenosylhomocysteine nucleosidase
MRDVVFIALKAEAPLLAELPWVFQTGVGKVNAALVAARIVERYRPMRVWNFGTAGGVRVSAGLHRCVRFVQRDMRVMALGFAPGQTPYEQGVVLDLGGEGLTCSTGDSFVTEGSLDIEADVVDMEAYAVAKVCREAGVEFRCYKFISDRADGASEGDWRTNIRKGEALYLTELERVGLWPRRAGN